MFTESSFWFNRSRMRQTFKNMNRMAQSLVFSKVKEKKMRGGIKKTRKTQLI